MHEGGGLGVEGTEVGEDVVEGAELGRLVEILGEGNLVAHLGLGGVEVGIRGVGADLVQQEGVDAAGIIEGDNLRVAERGVGLVERRGLGVAAGEEGADLFKQRGLEGEGLGARRPIRTGGG